MSNEVLQQEQQKIIDEYFDFLSVAIMKNLDLRDGIVMAQTVGFCELVVNTSSALLGAIGIATVLGKDINPLTFALLALLSVILLLNTILSVHLRTRILEANRIVTNDRAAFGESHIKELAKKVSEGKVFSKSFDEFIDKFRNLKKEEKKNLDEIREKLEKSEKKDMLRLKWVKRLLIGSMGMLVAILLIEINFRTGFLPLLLDFISLIGGYLC